MSRMRTVSVESVTGASADAFVEAFTTAKGRGDEIVCLVMSVESSFTYVAAEVAVRQVPGLQISIINTGRSLAAQAALAIAAAELAAAGRTREEIVRWIEELGVRVESGRFGAHMQVDLVNDGPVTIVLDSAELDRPRRN